MSNHKIKDSPQIKNTKIIGEIIPDNHLQGKLDDELIINVSLTPGVAGKSAYEIWLEQGHTGTEKDFLNWLKTDGSVIEEDPTVPGYVKEIKYEDILEWKQAYEHSQKRHAPVDAQKNSDITQSEIENKLIGTIITHNHDKQYVRNTGGTYTGDVEFKDSSLNFAAESSTKRAGLHWYNNGLFSSQIGVIPKLDLLLSFGSGENPTSISLKDKQIDISKNTFFKEKAYSASTSDKDPQNTLVTKDYVLGKIADADVNVTKEKIEEVLTGDITSHHHDERYDQRYVKLEDFTNIYTVKGHVDTYNDLLKIKDPKPGDVYNVLENGQNYVWIDAMDGQKAQWDKIGAAVDLTGYATESWVKNQQYTTEIDSIVQTTANVIGWEKNILFNADKKFTINEPNQKAVSLNEFFNGTLAPSNVSNISPDNPYIIEISGLPTIHTQGKGRVGWISRYRYPVDFKFEYFDGTEWILIDDVKNYNQAYYYSNRITGVVRSLRFTVYSVVNMEQAYAQIAQLVFIHPEAAQMYDDLLVKYKDIENFADQDWVEEQIANNKLPDNLAFIDKDNKFTKNQSVPKALELEHAMNLGNLEDFKVNELSGVNLLEPDLTGLEPDADGWYTILVRNNLFIKVKEEYGDYIYEINGVVENTETTYNVPFSQLNSGVFTAQIVYLDGEVESKGGAFVFGSPSNVGNHLYFRNFKNNPVKTWENIVPFRPVFYLVKGESFDKLKFKIKIEKGDKATPYTKPFEIPYYNVKIPTHTSELKNNSNFTTEDWVKNQLYITENDIKDRYATRTWVNNQKFINESTFNAALNNKVDKDGNKVLTDINFTKAYEDKLKGIESGAQKNPYSKSELDTKFDSFYSKSGGLISGAVAINSKNTPLTAKKQGSNSGILPAIVLERESSASGNQGSENLGIGVDFKASNSEGVMTRAGSISARLINNISNQERGEVILSPSFKNEISSNRGDFRIRAIDDNKSNAYLTGDLYVGAEHQGENGNKVITQVELNQILEELSSINYMMPKLKAENYLEDGWFLLNEESGITSKYNINTHEIEMDGVTTASIHILFDLFKPIPAGTTITTRIHYTQNEQDGQRGAMYVYPSPVTIILQWNQKTRTVTLSGEAKNVRLTYIPVGVVFNKTRFKLQTVIGDNIGEYKKPFQLPFSDIEIPTHTSMLENNSDFITNKDAINHISNINLINLSSYLDYNSDKEWQIIHQSNGITGEYNINTSMFYIHGTASAIGNIYRFTVPEDGLYTITYYNFNDFEDVNNRLYLIGSNHENYRYSIRPFSTTNQIITMTHVYEKGDIIDVRYHTTTPVYNNYFYLKINKGGLSGDYLQPYHLPYSNIKLPTHTSDLINNSDYITKTESEDIFANKNDIPKVYAQNTRPQLKEGDLWIDTSLEVLEPETRTVPFTRFVKPVAVEAVEETIFKAPSFRDEEGNFKR